MEVRFGDAEFLEEDVTHAVIVVLAGVHQAPIEDVFVLAKFADDGGHFMKLGRASATKIILVRVIMEWCRVRAVWIPDNRDAVSGMTRFEDSYWSLHPKRLPQN